MKKSILVKIQVVYWILLVIGVISAIWYHAIFEMSDNIKMAWTYTFSILLVVGWVSILPLALMED